jgi:hypothetical protein
MAKDEKRKSREAPKAALVDTTGATTDAITKDVDDTGSRGQQTTEQESSPISPTSPKGIKNLLNKFKRRSKHSPATAEADKAGFIGGAALRNSESHSQTQSQPGSGTASPIHPTHIPVRRDSEISSASSDDDRGHSPEPAPIPERTTSGLSEVSELSKTAPERMTTGQSGAYSDVSEYEEARDDFNDSLAPPPNFTTSDTSSARKGSMSRDSRFHEVGI